MVSGISSSQSSMGYYLQNQGMRTGPGPADMFKKVDTDGSGGVSQSELDTLATKLSSMTGTTIDTSDAMSTYDTDGNGELSDDELKSFMQATMPAPMGMQGPPNLFSDADTDGSGGISESELETLASTLSSATGRTLDTTDAISTYDTDGDGELSDDELKSFLDASGIMPPPPPQMGMNGTSDEDTTTSADSVISIYDTNGDGVLSSTELQAYLDSANQTSAQQGLAAYLQMDRASDGLFMNSASYGGGMRSVDYLA